MKKKRLVLLMGLLIVALVLMTVLVAGCGEDEQNNGETGDIPFYTTDREVFAIETPYCDLQYPMEWSNQIDIKSETLDEGYKLTFSAKLNEDLIPLYDITFETGNGDLLGVLESDGKQINVYVSSYDIDLEEYSEDERIDICGMNEDINVIISKLLEQYDFELA